MNQESILEKLSSELSTTIETISPSIVLVQGRRFPASGIVWQKNLIITADHSVPNSEQLQIATSAGEVILAAVAGRDPSTDIAILRTEKELQPISASQEKLKAGQLGIAVGRARGGRIIGKLTMVSGTEQEYRNWRGGILDQFIRLDTAAFPGFSGSAFVMPGGKIAGMNTAAFSRHFGLTVPASNIAKRVERLSSKGYFGGGGIEPCRNGRRNYG